MERRVAENARLRGTSRARPPMAAERRMLAPGTTVAGSTPFGKVSEDLVLRHACCLALGVDDLAELDEELALEFDG